MRSPQESTRNIPLEARENLTRILASPLFSRSPRQSAFLQFVVEKTLAGEQEQIKEYQIAVSVYGRRSDHSTRIDPIVRVEAARLRTRLLKYYASEGRKDEIRIELPKGSYVPEFRAVDVQDVDSNGTAIDPICEDEADRDESDPRLAPARARFTRRFWWAAAIAGTIVVACTAWAFADRTAGSPLVAPNSKIPDSIAVVSFQVRGDDQGPLGEEIAEAIIAELRQGNLPHVNIRSSIIHGDPALPQQRADAVLTGTVSVNAGVIRVTGSLEHQPSSIVLWNGAVERKLSDWPDSERGAMFEDLAYAVVHALGNALGERLEQEQSAAYPKRAAARQAWLEGDALQRQGDADSIRRSIELLEKAEALDPNFGWNHASLAFAYIRAVELGLSPEARYRRRAHEQVARALELSPYLAIAYAASARVSLALDGNIEAASATCMSGLNMFSAAASVRWECARVYSLAGRNDNAAALQLQSIRRTEERAFPLTELAWTRYRARRFGEARAAAEQALTLDPESKDARRVLALVQMMTGKAAESLTGLRTATNDPSGRLVALTATALALRGESRNAEGELAEAERRLLRPDRSDLIRPYLALGRWDRAKAAIEEAALQKNANLLDLLVDPQIAELDRTGLLDRFGAKR